MTRTERNTLVFLLTVVVVAVAGIVAAVVLGAKSPDSAEALTEESAVETTEDPTADDGLQLARTRLNSIHATDTPEAPDTWGEGRRHHEHFRTWEGEVTVWRGGPAQVILGPEGNWFPAGQVGCGDGTHLITFRATDLTQGAELTAQLRDAAGEAGVEKQLPEGWILADDCHLPYLVLTHGDAPSATVAYTVHEYQRVAR